jgi:hypothetical protein
MKTMSHKRNVKVNFASLLRGPITSVLTMSVASLVTVTNVSLASDSQNPAGRGPNSLNSSQKLPLNLVLFFNTASLSTASVTYDTFDLDSSDGLESLRTSVNEYLALYKIQKEQGHAKLKNQLEPENQRTQNVVAPGLKAPYNEFEIADKGLKAASTKILQLIDQVKAGSNPQENKYQIAQISRAVQQNYTDAYEGDFKLEKTPVYLFRYLSKPSVRTNDHSEDFTPVHLQKQLQTKSVERGANFYDFMQLKSEPKDCKYTKPKRGYGVHAGFQVDCSGEEYKVKFGNELYSGPFNTRIYRALGYLAPQINYQEALELKYDRKMFLEINQRRPMELTLSFANINLYNYTMKKMFDPFSFVKSFRLIDGTTITGAEGRAQLVGSAGLIEKEGMPTIIQDLKDSDFNKEFEDKIAQIVLMPSTVTVKNDDAMGTEIGMWSISDLDYSKIKEMRALMVLSAWIGNYDVRKQNLMVSLLGSGDQKELKLGFADAGSSLGRATLGIPGITSSVINDMPWTVTRVLDGAGKDNSGLQGQGEEVVEFSGLSNTEPNSSFNRIKLSDAQWSLSEMCKMIDRDRLTEALVVSGMSSAEVVLAREKLLMRRNQMLIDLKMPPDLRKSCFEAGINQKISYDPTIDGLVSIFSPAKRAKIEAPDNQLKVVKGVVVPRGTN